MFKGSIACIPDSERKIFGYNSVIKRANKHICHSKVRRKTKHLKKSDRLYVYFTFSSLFFFFSSTYWQMFDINGKTYASLRQFFSVLVLSIGTVCMIHVKLRFTVTLRKIHVKILPIILIDQVKILKIFSRLPQGDSWGEMHFWLLDQY